MTLLFTHDLRSMIPAWAMATMIHDMKEISTEERHLDHLLQLHSSLLPRHLLIRYQQAGREDLDPSHRLTTPYLAKEKRSSPTSRKSGWRFCLSKSDPEIRTTSQRFCSTAWYSKWGFGNHADLRTTDRSGPFSRWLPTKPGTYNPARYPPPSPWQNLGPRGLAYHPSSHCLCWRIHIRDSQARGMHLATTQSRYPEAWDRARYSRQ